MEGNVFNKLAAKYDTEERIELAKVIAKAVRRKLQDYKRQSLVDYGSGTGLVSLQLNDLAKSVLLVDSSKEMLDIAKGKITQNGISNASTLCADLTKERVKLQADIIMMSLVLLHIPDTAEILQNLYNILKPNGELIIIDFDKNEKINHPKVHNGFAHDELRSKLE